MRWFKHLTDSNSDEKLSVILSECGLEGYGFWWILLEVVAKQIDKSSEKCSATYTLPMWSRLLYCHHNKVGKYLGKLGVTGIVTVEYEGSNIRVIIPNLLKYRDEFTRKSGVTPESLRSKIQSIDTDTDTEIDREKDIADKAPAMPALLPEKELIPKAPAAPKITAEGKQAIDYYSNGFLAKFNERPIIHGAKDGVIMKSLCTRFGLERIQQLMDSFFDSPDPFIIKSGYTIGVFQSQINRLMIAGKSNPRHSEATNYSITSARNVLESGRLND